MLSARAELARRVLQVLSVGRSVSTQEALQLRNWAGTAEEAILPLEEIARRILMREGNQQSTEQ